MLNTGKSRRVDARLAAVIDALAKRPDLDLEVLERAPRQSFRKRTADFRKIAAKPVDRLFQLGGRTQSLDPRRISRN